MKHLALTAAIVVLGLFQQPTKAPEGTHGQHSADTQAPKGKNSAPSTVNVDTVNVSKLNVPQQPEFAGKTEKNSEKPPSYFCRLVAPETLPNTILCIIGIAGVFAAFYTLRAMKEQAGLMKRQADLMDGQLQEMQKGRELENKTLILQYRPKIIIRNAKALQFSFDLGKPWECEIRFQIVNVGGSPAYIATGSHIQLVSALGHDVGKIELKWGDERPLSNVKLEPGQGITVEECLPTGVLFDLDWENFNQGLRTEPLRSLYLVGIIHYTDDLSIPRSTGINRDFNAKAGEFTPKKETEQEYSD